ncbi:hypothetical protein Ae201684P_003207 [Aphanomyces euteiches]|nr:hypothetical protein Ae201684P_003207 [Aphanomyces euteiches]
MHRSSPWTCLVELFVKRKRSVVSKRRRHCCRERPHVVSLDGPVVTYTIDDRVAFLKDQTAMVGCRRVPFYPLQIACHRLARRRSLVLFAILEDDFMCESCRSVHLSVVPACISVSTFKHCVVMR